LFTIPEKLVRHLSEEPPAFPRDGDWSRLVTNEEKMMCFYEKAIKRQGGRGGNPQLSRGFPEETFISTLDSSSFHNRAGNEAKRKFS
jgi:hypothetical protein